MGRKKGGISRFGEGMLVFLSWQPIDKISSSVTGYEDELGNSLRTDCKHTPLRLCCGRHWKVEHRQWLIGQIDSISIALHPAGTLLVARHAISCFDC